MNKKKYKHAQDPAGNIEWINGNPILTSKAYRNARQTLQPNGVDTKNTEGSRLLALEKRLELIDNKLDSLIEFFSDARRVRIKK